ncbi:fatty acid desaturase [Melghiribacillus thermohalophilus]|uniref:Fatty acid desaturase n=1 Tax=Melghiribacillus thermohalophilus TaxID=1324956 RepID=A0A4R3MVF5_9BACI|nr:acyl-CoA desaturase [Melghiribacillus thermohalophilus]TCT20510.1 fatty acid desaturase [Melghiribacillus thermohalophilus]
MKNDLHTFGWYAARLIPHLPKKVFQPVPARLLGGLAYLFIVTGGIIAISLFDLNFWLSAGISVILGFSFAGLGFLGHEILHGTVVRKHWLRDWLGAIAFLPLSTGPSLWIKWHNVEHHGHTQDEERDPDAWLSHDQLKKNPILKLIYRIPFSVRSVFGFLSLAVTFTIHSFRMFLVYFKDFKSQKRPKVLLEFLIPWSIWIGLLFIIGFGNWIFAYLLPLLIANFIVMSYIATNHRLNPLVPVNDPLANSLSVTVPKWVDVLHFNFSYHTEHHLFPGMNPKYYPLVKKHIKKMWPERYHEMPMWKAMYALWKTPRVYYQKDRLIDPEEEHLYDTLGRGLDPDDIRSQKKSKEKQDNPFLHGKKGMGN